MYHATAAKQRLLADAIAYFAEHGTTDVSLRTLATAIGTSHRMLIYHFGSKEGLLVEVVQAIEAGQRAAIDVLDDRRDAVSAAKAFWRRISDPSLAPFERLFFEVYGQALQGRPWATPLLDRVVDEWVGPATDGFRARGMSPAHAKTEARLAVAVVRGLLLDLLATGDRKAVNAAADRFYERYASLEQRHR